MDTSFLDQTWKCKEGYMKQQENSKKHNMLSKFMDF